MTMNERHCCFNTSEELFYSYRIHVPLARYCSLGCVYCNYIKDGNITDDAYRPGTANCVVVSREEISEYLDRKISEFPLTHIIGVSGPGDPLENMDSLKTLISLMKQKNPALCLCICTNGRTGINHAKDILTHRILD